MSANGNEPGSQAPVARKTLNQTRNVRDLNTRLQMFVQSQNQRKNEIRRLKEENARQEMELKAKIQQQREHHNATTEKMRAEIENLTFDSKSTQQELSALQSQKKQLEERLITSESKQAEQASHVDTLQQENERRKEELDSMRKTYASLKYKYDSFEIERKSFEEKYKKSTKQNESLLRKLAKSEADLKAEKTAMQQVVIDKNDEIESQRAHIAYLEQQNDSTKSRLRKEFDTKLGEFVAKREDQYKLEKEEWMRIFKDEFNRKLSSYKTANEDLGADNKKKEGELAEYRTRISKLKQQKTELEVQNRNNEEEVEKLRNDLDDLRRTTDEEIKVKNQQFVAQRDLYKQKELEFDELAGVKMQLDAEIELYRSILNDAEEACGYMSPLDARNRSSGARNSRKRRRFNNMTPMGPLRESHDSNHNHNANGGALKNEDDHNSNSSKLATKVVTPGVERAIKMAEKDLKAFESADEEMKDEEEDDDCFDVDNGEYMTPGNVEGAQLQFSGLDLNKGMIEIQNTGESVICLNGYCLSNESGTSQYRLPKDIELEPTDKLRIYVGKGLYDKMKRNEVDLEALTKGFSGASVFWGRDVWTGKSKDCARLYNPDQKQVALMEISPEMMDKASAKNGCIVM